MDEAEYLLAEASSAAAKRRTMKDDHQNTQPVGVGVVVAPGSAGVHVAERRDSVVVVVAAAAIHYVNATGTVVVVAVVRDVVAAADAAG